MATVDRWTGEHACALQSALNLTNERFADRAKVSTRTVANWRNQGRAVLPDLAQRVLPELLDELPEPARQRFVNLLRDCGRVVSGGLDDAFVYAAEDAEADVMLCSRQCAPESVTGLWEEMTTIARAGNRTARDIFTSSKVVRDQARQLIEHTRHPGQLAYLYVVAGQASALMASTAFDLNHWDAAAKLARASTLYASTAGHASLEAWTYGLRATLANWRNEPDAALGLYRKGLAVAPAGAPRVRLRYIASRSHALLGEPDAVGSVLSLARQDQDDAEQSHDQLSTEVGGEFAFGGARAAACAAASWLDVGRGEEAEQQAQLALAELTELPRRGIL